MKTPNNRCFEHSNSVGQTQTQTRFAALVSHCRDGLEKMKSQLVQRFTSEFADVNAHIIRQAVNEAAALAALTGIPHLVLPVLAEEKVEGVREWARRQQEIRERSQFSFAA